MVFGVGDGTMRDEWNLIHAYKSWYCTLHYTDGLNKAEASLICVKLRRLESTIFSFIILDFRQDEKNVPFALLKKQAEILFRLICYERKTLFWMKKQAEKYRL